MSAPTNNQAKSFLGRGADVYALQLLESIGSGLSEEDQEWLSSHLASLPHYLKTTEGARVVTSVVRCYRTYLEYRAGSEAKG